jgi:dihydroorotase
MTQRSDSRHLSSLTLIRPDDWHVHVRDGEALKTVVPHTAAQFGRAVIMPNVRPPVTTAAQAVAYRERILAAAPPPFAGPHAFQPFDDLVPYRQPSSR